MQMFNPVFIPDSLVYMKFIGYCENFIHAEQTGNLN